MRIIEDLRLVLGRLMRSAIGKDHNVRVRLIP
jgi:hypothetical protein